MNRNFWRLAGLLFLLFSSLTIIAQDTTYFNQRYEPIEAKDNHTYYMIIRNDSTSSQHVIKSIFLKSGILVKEITTLKENKKIKDGIEREWYEDGQLKSELPYSRNNLHGLLTTYYPNGSVRRKDKFENNVLQYGECFDISGKKLKHFPYHIPPSFQGGIPKFKQYISKNLIYPKDLSNAGIEDRVIVSFFVETDGSISSVAAEDNTPIKLFKEEAIRLVSEMPQWIPGKIDGETVRLKCHLPIHFQL